MDMERIEQLVKPYLPQEKGLTFFHAIASIEESPQGKEARALYGDISHRNAYSLGVLIDTQHGNHQVQYNHSHRMENGYVYNTILGRPLKELSKEELDNIYKNLAEKVEAKKVYPAVIREDYDADIGDEDHNYFAVVFDKPFDVEQESAADRHECETINQDKSEYIFMDYDNAIGFAAANARLLESRGNLRREIGDDERPYFCVTFESCDKRLESLAKKYNGGIDYSSAGTPLAMAVFLTVKDARAYRMEAGEILSLGGNTVSNPLAKVLSGDITHEEIQKSMGSNLVKSWLKADKNQPFRSGFDLFGLGSIMVHDFAKARLNIDNRYDTVNMFDNSWEAIEGYITHAKEKGLDLTIADKYDFRSGSGDPERIMEHPEAIYSEQELNEISRFLTPAGFEDFKDALRSLTEAKQIAAEEERIKNYHNGEALTKAFVLYDIAARRLRSEHQGDERFFRRERRIVREDGTTYHPGVNGKPGIGESETFRWVLKKDVARELMRLIAVSPITEKMPLIDSKTSQSSEQGKMNGKGNSFVNYINDNYPGLIKVFKDRASDPAAKAFTKQQLDIVKDARDRHVMSPSGQKEFFGRVWDAMRVEGMLSRIPEAWIKDAKQEVNDICEGKLRNNAEVLKR